MSKPKTPKTEFKSVQEQRFIKPDPVVIPILERQKQKDHKFKSSVGNIVILRLA